MRRTAKLLVALALVGAGGALAFAGAAPEGYRTVTEALADPALVAGQEMTIKASVVEGSLDRAATPLRFLVTDGVAQMPVRWDPALPLPDHEAGGSIEGKTVVVTGRFVDANDGPHLLASDMKVGCASKYRAA